MTNLRRRWEYFRDLILVLTQKEIAVRYQSTWFGYLWSLAHPLAFALLYSIVFGVFMRVQIPHYALFLIAGLFPWQWLANSLTISSRVFLGNAALLKKVAFPRHALVVSMVLNDCFHFLISIPVVLIFLLYYGFAPSWAWLWGVPALCLLEALTAYGIALFIASLNLFFRDLERLVVLGTTALFFLTPIAFSESMIPGRYRTALLYLNPVSPLIVLWRELFLHGRLSLPLLAAGCFYAAAAWLAGTVVYGKLQWKFAEVV
jgi:lipopolysaccharide transport system permease protein